MKKLFFILIVIFFIGCDDGDFAIEVFDFDDSNIQLCGDYVFYKLTNDNTEALLIQITSNDELFLQTEGTKEYQLSANNHIYYRIFDGSASDYFCKEVQPVNPKVIEQWEATSGTIEIVTTLIEDDNDGIPAEKEGYNTDEPTSSQDTDGDGIPDYKDIDDDGDNVPTAQEGYNADDPSTSLDTDGDGIFNYLDKDDDGDGIDTRLENPNQNTNPTDDITDGYEVPDYLEPAVSNEYPDVNNRTHTFQKNYIHTIKIINGFQLQGNGQEIKYNVSGFNYGVYENNLTETHQF